MNGGLTLPSDSRQQLSELQDTMRPPLNKLRAIGEQRQIWAASGAQFVDPR